MKDRAYFGMSEDGENPFDPDRMLRLAISLHEGQNRNHGAPYISHPLAVVERISLWGFDKNTYPEMWAIGYGHDLIEDTGVTEEFLVRHSNVAIAQGISHLTFRKRRQDESKEEYQRAKKAHRGSFGDRPPVVRVLKAADIIENTESFLLEYLVQQPARNYAATYWDNAEPFWERVWGTRPELDGVFGKGRVSRMRADYEQLDARLAATRSG